MIPCQINVVPADYERLKGLRRLLIRNAERLGFDNYSETESFQEDNGDLKGKGLVLSGKTKYSDVLISIFLYPNCREGSINFFSRSTRSFDQAYKRVIQITGLTARVTSSWDMMEIKK
jgi:hypothetical protein